MTMLHAVNVGHGFSQAIAVELAADVRPAQHDTTCEVLVRLVAGVFEIDAALLFLPTRGSAAVARARQVAMYIAHVGFGLNLTEVGQMFQRDRTTVAHACQVVEEGRDDREFDHAVGLLEQAVRLILLARRC